MDARPGSSGPSAAVGSVVPAAPVPGAPSSSVPNGLDAVEIQLGRLADLTIAEHVQVFTDIHQQLTEALALTGGPSQPGGQPAVTGQPRPGGPQSFQRGR